MPSRPLLLAIVAFWLATAVWFFDRDVWPYIRPDAAPPYTIELADEASRQSVPVRWVLSRNDEDIGIVKTHIQYSERDDTFELTAESSELVLLGTAVLAVKALKLKDQVRVNRDGELRATSFEVTLEARLLGAAPIQGQVTIAAQARNDRLERRCRVELPGLGTFEPALEPVPLTSGSVLNPLHPVPRITGLRPGQHWRQPLVDPRGDILRALLKNLPGGEQASALASQKPQSLYAEVRAAPEPLRWEGGEHLCLVVEYRGDLRGEEFRARTWVRVADGNVLRQEFEAFGEVLVLKREQQ
jgi:hypothetical protein